MGSLGSEMAPPPTKANFERQRQIQPQNGLKVVIGNIETEKHVTHHN